MNNLPENRAFPSLAGTNKIEDYLDHLCTPLVGQVPYVIRRQLRLEAEDHLCALIAEFVAKGLTPEDACDTALQEHGEPWTIGQSYADAWIRTHAESWSPRFVAPHLLHGLAWVGTASIPILLLVEQGCLARNSISFERVAVLAILAPFVAGSLTGLTAPAQPVRAVSLALLLHLLVSFTAGCLLWPEWDVLRFAGFQLLFWLPAACGSAWTVASFRLSHRRQRFLRRVCSKVM